MPIIFPRLSFFPITYEEVLNTRTFSYVGNTPKGSITFDVPWESRFDFAVEMLGNAQVVDINTNAPKIIRNIPHYYPNYFKYQKNFDSTLPFTPVMYAKDVESIVPVGPRAFEDHEDYPNLTLDTEYNYCKARVKINYEAPTFSYKDKIIEDELERESTLHSNQGLINPPDAGQLVPVRNRNLGVYITKIIQPSVEVLRLPYGYMKWAHGLKNNNTNTILAPVKETNITGLFKMKPQNEITYVFHHVPSLPKKGWLIVNNDIDTIGTLGEEILGAVFTHVGCVNSTDFDGYVPGTLLLKSVEIRPYKWIDGHRYFDYIYHISHFFGINELSSDLKIIKDGNAQVTNFQIGHNHFLRLQPPKKDGAGALVVEPFYALITSDGKESGKPVFSERNFYDLFTPFNKDYMFLHYGL